MEEEEATLHDTHRRHRVDFWSKTAAGVSPEQKETEFGVEDYVDSMAAQITAGTTNMTCKDCLSVQRSDFLVCPE